MKPDCTLWGLVLRFYSRICKCILQSPRKLQFIKVHASTFLFLPQNVKARGVPICICSNSIEFFWCTTFPHTSSQRIMVNSVVNLLLYFSVFYSFYFLKNTLPFSSFSWNHIPLQLMVNSTQTYSTPFCFDAFIYITECTKMQCTPSWW